jgi:hypothetical protein
MYTYIIICDYNYDECYVRVCVRVCVRVTVKRIPLVTVIVTHTRTYCPGRVQG